MSWQDLCTRSLKEVSWQDLCKGLLARFQHISMISMQCLCTHEKGARAISKWAPRHSESDLTGPKWQEGCAGDLTIRTAPCTTRAIRCAQSDERVAQAHVRFSQKIAPATKHEHWKSQKQRFTEASAFFLSRSTKYCACHEKWAWGIRSLVPATQNHHHVPNQIRRQFHKTRFSTLAKRHPSSPSTAPATKNDLQKHL